MDNVTWSKIVKTQSDKWRWQFSDQGDGVWRVELWDMELDPEEPTLATYGLGNIKKAVEICLFNLENDYNMYVPEDFE